MSAYFAWANRNKESIALDLKHPLGRGALMSLVQRADVLVQNLAPGAAARLGLDAASRSSKPVVRTESTFSALAWNVFKYIILLQYRASGC
jgi:hypothetical protein